MKGKKKFFSFNNPSLLLDIGVFIYASFFLFTLTGKNEASTNTTFKILGLASIFIMQTTLPLYIIKIAHSYSRLSNKKIGSLLISFMNMVFPVSIFFAFVSGFAAMRHLNIESSGSTVTGIIFGSLFALFFGYFSGDTLYRKKNEEGFSTALNYIAAFISVFSFYICIMGFIIGFMPGIVTLVIISISTAIIIILHKTLKKKLPLLAGNKIFQKYYPLAGEFLLNIALVFSLSFMLEIQSVDMLNKLRGDLPASVFALTFTGYLPLRILVEFEPPLTSFTIFTGIISTGYFLFRLTGL